MNSVSGSWNTSLELTKLIQKSRSASKSCPHLRLINHCQVTLVSTTPCNRILTRRQKQYKFQNVVNSWSCRLVNNPKSSISAPKIRNLKSLSAHKSRETLQKHHYFSFAFKFIHLYTRHLRLHFMSKEHHRLLPSRFLCLTLSVILLWFLLVPEYFISLDLAYFLLWSTSHYLAVPLELNKNPWVFIFVSEQQIFQGCCFMLF